MLTQAQQDQFAADGFIVVENVIDSGTLTAVVDEYAALMDRLYDEWHDAGLVPASKPGMTFFDKIGLAERNGVDWYQHFDISLPHDGISDATPMHHGPAVFAMITHANVLDMVEALLGPEISSNPIQHVRIKPPNDQVGKGETRAQLVSTDWHQDKGVTLESANETQMITVWIAINDATIENGCLQVKPGTRVDILPHCLKTQVGITDNYLPAGEPVPTPVKAGGAVVFHPLTPHASLSNQTDGYRWSFDIRYHVTGQSSGREQFPSFVARSRRDPGSVLRDPAVWKDMWETTRHTLAHSEVINQHRWAADGPYCA